MAAEIASPTPGTARAGACFNEAAANGRGNLTDRRDPHGANRLQ